MSHPSKPSNEEISKTAYEEIDKKYLNKIIYSISELNKQVKFRIENVLIRRSYKKTGKPIQTIKCKECGSEHYDYIEYNTY